MTTGDTLARVAHNNHQRIQLVHKMLPRSKLSKGSSFVEEITLNSKADKLFGLDQLDNSLKPQKAGWLLKKPFGLPRTSSGIGIISRKRWVAVKDSFLFWWDSEWKAEVGFDTKPRGVLPLGGAIITTYPDNLTFEITHPVFTRGESLVLKASDRFEANEWISAIKAGMQATWENAILGFALIEKLKAKGSELEIEKDEAVQRAEYEAARLLAEREEAERLIQIKLAQAQIHQEEVASVEDRMDALQKQVSMKEDEFSKERKEAEIERQRREALEHEVQEAQDALSEIEAIFEAFEQERLRQQLALAEKEKEDLLSKKRALSVVPPTPAEQAQIAKAAQEASEAQTQKFADEEQVRKNVAALRVYFEATAKTHEMRRQALTRRKQ